MNEISQFSDFGIAVKKSFIGPSVWIETILDQEIIVEDYKIGPSTKKDKKEGDECLTLQINIEGKQSVIFSGSTFLIQVIRDAANLKRLIMPFRTKIIKINRHYEFR